MAGEKKSFSASATASGPRELAGQRVKRVGPDAERLSDGDARGGGLGANVERNAQSVGERRDGLALLFGDVAVGGAEEARDGVHELSFFRGERRLGGLSRDLMRPDGLLDRVEISTDQARGFGGSLEDVGLLGAHHAVGPRHGGEGQEHVFG